MFEIFFEKISLLLWVARQALYFEANFSPYSQGCEGDQKEVSKNPNIRYGLLKKILIL